MLLYIFEYKAINQIYDTIKEDVIWAEDYNQEKIEFISSFQFNNTFEININNEVYIDFELDRKANTKKVCPILRMASVEDAVDIVEIYENVYDDYPYKEMLDVDEIKKMILNDAIKWIMFLDRKGNSITFNLEIIF